MMSAHLAGDVVRKAVLTCACLLWPGTDIPYFWPRNLSKSALRHYTYAGVSSEHALGLSEQYWIRIYLDLTLSAGNAGCRNMLSLGFLLRRRSLHSGNRRRRELRGGEMRGRTSEVRLSRKQASCEARASGSLTGLGGLFLAALAALCNKTSEEMRATSTERQKTRD
jgi:hypothetical protein